MLGINPHFLAEGVLVMNTLKEVLEYESRPKTEQSTTTMPVGISSQYELLKLLFTTDPELAKAVIDIHTFKHPVAVQKQKALFGYQPGLFSLLISVTTDSYHPLRGFDEFALLRSLLDKTFPTITNSFDDILDWSRRLDLALLRFLHCALVYEDNPGRLVSGGRYPKLFIGISPVLFTKEYVHAARLMDPPLPIYRIGVDITNIAGVLVHGPIVEAQEQFILGIAAAHKYFMARKITILKNLEGNTKFSVGLYNVMTKVKETPFMCIGYRINEEDSHNIPEQGIDFNDIVPVICVDPNCRQGSNCVNSMREYKYIYIKTSTVHLGEPPYAASNTVDFAGMKKAWKRKTEVNEYKSVVDPMDIDKGRKLKFRKRKGTDCSFRMIWEDAYLRFLMREFRKKDKEDIEMIEQHLMPIQAGEPYSNSNLRLDDGFGAAFTLFMPSIYQKL